MAGADDLPLGAALEQLTQAEAAFDDADTRMEAALADRESAEKRIAAMERRLAGGVVKSLNDLRAKARYLNRFAKADGDKAMIPDVGLQSLLEGVAFLESRAAEMGVAL